MARIVLNVELNNQKVPAGIKQIREQIASLGDAFGKIQNAKDVTDGIKALTDQYKALAEAASGVVKVYKKQMDEEAKLKSKYLDLEKQYADFIKTTQKAGEQNKDFADGMKGVLKSIEDAHARLRAYNKEETDVIESTEELNLMLKEAKKESASLGMEYRTLTKSLKDGAEAEKAVLEERIRQEIEAAEKIAYNRKEEQRLNEETANERKRQETEEAEAIKKTREEEERLLQERLEAQRKLKESYEQAWASFDKVFGNAAIRLWRTWWSEVKNILGDVNDVLTKTENTVIELQRVLNDTVSDRQISNALYELAQKYGQTFENASTIAQNFAKSGMSWNDTIKATESALLAMNVAELNASESSEGLLSILVQFKKEASELETVVDQLNKTADKNPVTTEKLLKALQRTGSAAATSNLSLEKTIGIITTLSAATNRSGQNIGTATNALIMYTQKNLEKFAQMSEESAKVVQNFKEGTADIIDIWRTAQDEIEKMRARKGEINSILDLFGDSTDVEELNSTLHDELEDIFDQTVGIYQVANTYRKNYFIALLDNLDRFDKVQEQLQDAQGYSQEENLKYMGTLEAKLNTLQAKWEYIANDEQGLLKFRKDLVDLGIGALDLIKNMGGIVNVLMTISGIIGGLVITVKSATLATKVKEITSTFIAMKHALEGVATAAETTEASFGWIGIAVAAVSALFGALKSLLGDLANARQEAIDAAEASKNNALQLKEQYDKLQTLDEKSDEYYEVEKKIVDLLGDKAKKLNEVEEGTKKYTDAVKDLTKQELAQAIANQKKAIESANPLADDNVRKYFSFGGLFGNFGHTLETLEQYVPRLRFNNLNDPEPFVRAYRMAAKELQILNEQIADAEAMGAEETVKAEKAKAEALEKALSPIRDSFETYIQLQETYVSLTQTYKEFTKTVHMASQGSLIPEGKSLKTLSDLSAAFDKIITDTTTVKENIDLLAKVQNELNKSGVISTETLQALIKLGGEYADVVEVQNGRYVINKKKLDELLKSKEEYLNDLINEEVLAYAQIRADELLAESQNAVAEASANAAVGMATLTDATKEAAGEAGDTAEKYLTLADRISEIAKNTGLSGVDTSRLFNDVYSYEQNLRAALKDWFWSPTEDDTGDAGKNGDGSGKFVDEDLERIKATISLRKSELTLMEHQGKSMDDQISKMREIQASLHDQVVHMTKVNKEAGKEIYSLTDINALSSEWWSYQEKILKLYQDTLNAAKEIELEAIEDLISSIQEQIDLEKEELSIAEKREAVAKAELDYANAIKEARKEYVLGVLSDYLTALSDAQTLEEKRKAVTEAREKYATAQKEAQTKAVIDAMKAQKDLGNDALSLEEKRLAVEEARQALIDAENDRTTRVFDEATGEWHYEANAQNVKSAQERLADAMKSLDDYLEGEAWDELLEKMENGSLTEGETASILNKWASEGYGSSEWVDKIREAYRTAIGTKADPDSLTGELNAVNSAVDNLNTYLKNQAIKELQQYIKDGNTSTEGMQQIMNKWLSMGEGGEIWNWSNGVVSKVSEAIQSGKYDDSKVQSSINNVVSAINGLKTAIENSYINKLNKLLTNGTAEEMLALIAAAKASGEVNQGVLDPYEELQRLKAQKEEIEKRYEEASKAYDENNLNNAMAIVDGNGNVAIVASTNASGLDSSTAKVVNDVVENVGAKFDAALAKQSMGIMVGATDRTPSATPIYNSSSSNMSDSHDTTINGVPIPVGMADKYTLSEMVDILSILG